MERFDYLPTIIDSGYNIQTDEQWYRFSDGELRCVDVVNRGEGTTWLPPGSTPEMIYRYGRNPVQVNLNAEASR